MDSHSTRRQRYPGALNADGRRPQYAAVQSLDGLESPDAAGGPQTIRLIASERAALRVIALDTFPKSGRKRGTHTPREVLAAWAGLDPDTFTDAVRTLSAKDLIRETGNGGLVLTLPPQHVGGPEWRASNAPHAAALSIIPGTWMTNIERCMMFDAIATADRDGVFLISTGQWGRRVGIRGNHTRTHRASLRSWVGMRPPVIRAIDFNNGPRPSRYSLTLPDIASLSSEEFEAQADNLIPKWSTSSLIAASDDILSLALDAPSIADAAPWLAYWTSPHPPNGATPWTSPPPSPTTSPPHSPIPPPGLVHIHRSTSSTSSSTSSSGGVTRLVTEETTPLALSMLRRLLAPVVGNEPKTLIGLAQLIALNNSKSRLATEYLHIAADSMPSDEVAAFTAMSSIVAEVRNESLSTNSDNFQHSDISAEIYRRFDSLAGATGIQ